MINLRKFIERCDLIIFGALCGMIWFVPISSAGVEWMFGICLITFLTKRCLCYRQELADTKTSKLIFSRKNFLSALSYLKPVGNPLNKPIFVLVLVALLSAIFGVRPYVSIPAIITKLLQDTFTAFFIVETVNSSKRLKIILGFFLASIFMINIDGMYQYVTQTDFMRGRVMTDGRLSSAFRHPNDFASYLIVVIPILISLSVVQFLNLKDMKMGFVKFEGFFNSVKFLTICFILAIVSTISLGLTYSRAGWLACGLCLFFLVYKRPKLLAVYCALGILFLGIFTVKMVHERTTNIGGSYKNALFNVSDRDNNWREALGMIKKNPVFGVGLNNYTLVATLEKFRRPEYPHNCYLQITAEMGIVGLIAFIWVLWTLYKVSLIYLRQLKDSLNYHLLLGAMVGLGAFLVQSFFDTNFYSTQLSALMWLTVGLILAIPKIELKN
ncbi:MAG: O-antigen ligase family protein [Candidatus Omnitrophica bacterium]|nr:O-antigen ligase family protein [Candidatus Omnitrophota bacterium]